jgi:hypothetical protein
MKMTVAMASDAPASRIDLGTSGAYHSAPIQGAFSEFRVNSRGRAGGSGANEKYLLPKFVR